MTAREVDELGVEEVLDTVEAIRASALEGECATFVLAAHFADLHAPAPRDHDEHAPAGRERAVRLGGQGTPLVREFAAAEFGARMGISPYGGRCYIADALDARHRLPLLWARVERREVRVSFVRHVAAATRALGQAAARRVDAEVAEVADGRIGWSRFTTLVAAAVKRADPDAAAAAEAEAAARQFARATRSSDNGTRGFYVRSTIGAIAQIDAVVGYLADALKALGDPDDVDLRRVKALLVLTNPVQALDLLQAFAGHRAATGTAADEHSADDDTGPTEDDDTSDDSSDNTSDDAPAGVSDRESDSGLDPQRFRPDELRADPSSPGYTAGAAGTWSLDLSGLLPRVTLFLHLSHDTLRRGLDGVARWEGEGPVTAQYVRDVLALHHRFTIRPVLDLERLRPVDAYEIPQLHRTAVHLRSPADVFPFGSSTSRAKDIDHVEPFVPMDRGGPPGQSCLDNYAPLTRLHHRIKTHGRWQLKQPFPGVYVWRDPHGQYYVVDNTGTRRVPRPTTRQATTTRQDRRANGSPAPFHPDIASTAELVLHDYLHAA